MRVYNLLYGIDYSGLNKIAPDVSYIKDKKIKEKYSKYKKFLQLKEKKIPIKEIESIIELSKSEFYRIRKKLKTSSWKGLERKSTRPKTFRKSSFSLKVKDKILEIRRENPTYGKDKITAILKREYLELERISSSSVGRILIKFREQKKIFDSPSFYRKRKKRKFNKHAQRWIYGKHKANNIGELVQIDHMTIRKNEMNYKHFSLYDKISKIMFSKVYSSASSLSAKHFLQEALTKLPFRVKSIQVDGGSEFMQHFENYCKDEEIPLFVLPPRSPKLNGNVERSNRIFREEFYIRKDIYANNVGEMNFCIEKFLKKYNEYRPHNALNFKTPMQYFKEKMGVNFSQML